MERKRALAALIALGACTASSLVSAGCGGGGDPSGENNGGEPASAAPDPVLACLEDTGLRPEEEPVPAYLRSHGLEREIYFAADKSLVMRFYDSAKRAEEETPPAAASAGAKTVAVGSVVINSVTGQDDDATMKQVEACI